MQTRNVLLFQPVREIQRSLLEKRDRKIIHISPSDNRLKKGCALVRNGFRRCMYGVALAIATVFYGIYSLFSYSRRYDQAKLQEKVSIEADLSRLEPAERPASQKAVFDYFEKHKEHFGSYSKEQKDELVETIVSQMARSGKVYGPIVRQFVDFLLEKAESEGLKLVFMARDGISFYQVAVELMKTDEYKGKYPNLAKDGRIVLGHFSRKVVHPATATKEAKIKKAKETEKNKPKDGELAVAAEGVRVNPSEENKPKDPEELFSTYAAKELKLQDGDKCIFADIGYAGSMTDSIRKLLPNIEIDFHFLIATTDKAKGFISNLENPLSHFETVHIDGPAMRWLEETHNGTLASAEKLVEGVDGHVYPNTKYPEKVWDAKKGEFVVKYQKIRFKEKFTTEYLVRKFCLRALVQQAVKIGNITGDAAAKARAVFDETLVSIRQGKSTLATEYDY